MFSSPTLLKANKDEDVITLADQQSLLYCDLPHLKQVRKKIVQTIYILY